MRIIDADELRLGKFVEPRTEWHKGWNDALDAAHKQVPTISPDSLVKRGRWKNIHIAIVGTTGNCTVCGQEAVWRTRKKPYANCPNCGALMED